MSGNITLRVQRARAWVFTIEPKVNQGTRMVSTEQNGWTVLAKDRKLSAQFEHTVAVTGNGVDVLTLRGDGNLIPIIRVSSGIWWISGIA